jgi:hypothetical protein
MKTEDLIPEVLKDLIAFKFRARQGQTAARSPRRHVHTHTHTHTHTLKKDQKNTHIH